MSRFSLAKLKVTPARIFCALVLLGGIPDSFAEDLTGAPSWEAHAGLSALHFGYKEFGDDGALLDREDGYIPGVVFGLRRLENGWGIAGDVSYHAGDVDYNGQTNIGTPLVTRSDAKIADLAARVERQHKSSGNVDYGLYGGLGYHSWERDVRSTSTANGIFEKYEWWYGFLGANAHVIERPQWYWSVDARLLRIINPKIHVDFLGLYDDVDLDLGARSGVRLSLPWRYALNRSSALSVEPYLERWDLGRSPNAPLMRNGAVIGSVFEPRSETRNYGLNLSMIRGF